MSEPGREPCGSRAEDHPPFQAEAASARAGHPLVPGWWVFIIGVVAGTYFTFGWVYEFSRGKYAH